MKGGPPAGFNPDDSDEERANGATLRQIAQLRKDVAEMSVATRSNRATDHRKMCKGHRRPAPKSKDPRRKT